MASKTKASFKVKKKKNGRFMVVKRGGAGLINGEEKAKILQDQGLVKKLKAKAQAAEGEASTEGGQ